ncbi:hypothetical protein HAX54_006484 [Datura stramonium]|uniref:Uncharacterized protein n=1 Tax=Datura stramonium TaxID=4076 RepID=A0ABS8WU25_DATST|nr:hypothetical protein [Datura stramonium]
MGRDEKPIPNVVFSGGNSNESNCKSLKRKPRKSGNLGPRVVNFLLMWKMLDHLLYRTKHVSFPSVPPRVELSEAYVSAAESHQRWLGEKKELELRWDQPQGLLDKGEVGTRGEIGRGRGSN